MEKFKTLFFVKSSLISLYLALTIPIPFISIDRLKNISFFIFILGVYLITMLTSDYVVTCDKKFHTKLAKFQNFLGEIVGRFFGKILN